MSQSRGLILLTAPNLLRKSLPSASVSTEQEPWWRLVSTIERAQKKSVNGACRFTEGRWQRGNIRCNKNSCSFKVSFDCDGGVNIFSQPTGMDQIGPKLSHIKPEKVGKAQVYRASADSKLNTYQFDPKKQMLTTCYLRDLNGVSSAPKPCSQDDSSAANFCEKRNYNSGAYQGEWWVIYHGRNKTIPGICLGGVDIVALTQSEDIDGNELGTQITRNEGKSFQMKLDESEMVKACFIGVKGKSVDRHGNPLGRQPCSNECKSNLGCQTSGKANECFYNAGSNSWVITVNKKGQVRPCTAGVEVAGVQLEGGPTEWAQTIPDVDLETVVDAKVVDSKQVKANEIVAKSIVVQKKPVDKPAENSVYTDSVFAGTVTAGSVNVTERLSAGSVIAGTVTSTSDGRLKKNIAPVDQALDKVSQLQGVYYDFRVQEFPEKSLPEGRQMGLIAQQVEGVAPEVVLTDSSGMKSVAYQNLVALLIESVKELKAQNRELQKKMDRLEKTKRSSCPSGRK